jgi:hypothetical protein
MKNNSNGHKKSLMLFNRSKTNRMGVKEVVTHPSLGKSCDALTEENAALQKKCSAEKAKNELVNISLRVTGFQMQYMRVAAGKLKAKLLGAIDTAKAHLSLKDCLDSIGLTAARYHSWIKRRPQEVPVGQVKCLLPDQSTCPKLSPTKITSKETFAIKELVTAKEYTHFSINSLVMFAKRKQMVFASVSAWYRIVREFNLRRSGVRIYPPKPKIGIRAMFLLGKSPKITAAQIPKHSLRRLLKWRTGSPGT